jgi:predicted NUDIX family NTP pyrophosphohydrolase
MEWPPRSGRVETFPEIDRVEWFKLNQARRKLKTAQVPFLDRLQAAIAADRWPTVAGGCARSARPPRWRTIHSGPAGAA